ncbi:MAG: Sapep family Mn(2+)-dependent dipeptidase [Oscillospiraceae bacterium]|nr:Sapep family Mn(2+)-dependent dipeptidase [Oscillospiraceae bacterium]
MYKQQIDAYFADQEQLLIDAVCRLVSIDSVEGEGRPGAPFGPGPAAALSEALKLAEEWGLITENHEGYVGTADLNDREDALHILGHLDVVAPGEGWTVTAPYAPKVMDGLIYGRGTDDDKGPVVASLLAMKAVKDLGIPLKRNCRCIMGTNEESGSGDIAWYFARHPFAPATFSPDSGFPVINTEKGMLRPTFSARWPLQETLPRLRRLDGGIRMNILPADASADVEGLSAHEIRPIADGVTARTGVRFTVTEEDGLTHIAAKGEASHAAWPEGGVNANTGLITLLCALPLADGPCRNTLHALNDLMPHGDCYGKAMGIAQEDEVSGKLTLTFSLLQISDTGMEGHFDSRGPLCATEENCLQVAKAAFEARGLAFEAVQLPPHHTPADSAFVKTLLKRYEQYTGLVGECQYTGGGTYVHDIPGGVAFGCAFPGFDTHIHGADERVRISDLMVSARMFAHIIIDMCS